MPFGVLCCRPFLQGWCFQQLENYQIEQYGRSPVKEDIDEMIAKDVIGTEIPVEGKGKVGDGAEKTSFFTWMGEKNLGRWNLN